MNDNTISNNKPTATYQPKIQRKHRQPRHAIRRLLRSFEPLTPAWQHSEPADHSGGN